MKIVTFLTAAILILFLTWSYSRPAEGNELQLDTVASEASASANSAEELATPGSSNEFREDSASVSAAPEAPEGGASTEMLKSDEGALVAYIEAQPPWAADDQRFVEKYADFDIQMLTLADSVLTAAVRADQDIWVPTRIDAGDFDRSQVDDDGISVGFPPYKTKEKDKCARFMGIELPDGSTDHVRLEFSPEDYPLVHYRSREFGYVMQRLKTLGYEFVDNTGDSPVINEPR